MKREKMLPNICVNEKKGLILHPESKYAYIN